MVSRVWTFLGATWSGQQVRIFHFVLMCLYLAYLLGFDKFLYSWNSAHLGFPANIYSRYFPKSLSDFSLSVLPDSMLLTASTGGGFELALFVLAIGWVIVPRSFAVGLANCTLYLFLFLQSDFAFKHSLYLFWVVLVFWLVFVPRELRPASLFVKGESSDKRTETLFPGAIRGLLVFVYLATVIVKLNEGWWDGEVFQSLVVNNRATAFGSEILSLAGNSHQYLAISILGLEVAIAILLLIKKSQWAFVLGLCLHLGIALFMYVGIYTALILVLIAAVAITDEGRRVQSRRAYKLRNSS